MDVQTTKSGIRVHRCRAVVLGSGCAGLAAADALLDMGLSNVLLVTEGMNCGTSRNTGSDKQTYYKLTLAGGEADSVFAMAQTLFAGGGVHGDIALCEAAGSAAAFLKLCGLGVPFPKDAFGQYVGYKTDHDPARRATSAGPLTSKYMTEALEKSVRRKGINILDAVQVFKILVRGGRAVGLLGLDENGLVAVLADAVVLCTGGPAAIYQRSVYPGSQRGGTGLAIEAGAALENLDLWQYGLASTEFRWNVSGSYQQVLPKYVSVDNEGREFDFLHDALGGRALELAFLKGYQWPFDEGKKDGSSQIDMLVHEQEQLGREVYMDFRQNPTGFHLETLPQEPRRYLQSSGCTQATPIARLAHMNPQAILLYQANGIDLHRQRLKVSVCAQHINGGVAVDAHWQSSIKGLYVAGEAAGTFGAYRPGGSALNSTQVGAARAAEHIARQKQAASIPLHELEPELEATLAELGRIAAKPGNAAQILQAVQAGMSGCAAHIRNVPRMQALLEQVETGLRQLNQGGAGGAAGLPGFLGARDSLLTARAVLASMIFAAQAFGSRGSGMVQAEGGGWEARVPGMEGFVVRYQDGCCSLAPVRPMPTPDDWFENVWREYRLEHGL